MNGGVSREPARRIKLLLVGHSYAALENRKKIQALAQHFDLLCITSVPDHSEILGQRATDFDNDSDAPARTYRLLRLVARGGSNTTFHYSGFCAALRAERFDVVLVENEPWSVLCWQARFGVALWQRQALFGEFTWENVARPGIKGMALRLVYRAMTATTDFMICGSKAAAKLVAESGMSRADIQIAPQLGVDLASHQPASATARAQLRENNGLPPVAFIVGFAGRYTEEKGVADLLSACDLLRSTECHENLHLALIGSGPLEGALRDAAKTRPWLHLFPPRPHFEIPDFLRSLDVMVLASKPLRTRRDVWEEQFGHVLIEAMACGVATLGSSSGAIPEVLEDAEAVFPWGDVKAMAASLTWMKKDLTARKSLAFRQAQRVRHCYTHDAVAAQWAEFIQQQLAA